MSEERYTYSIHPSKPIRTLVPGKNINRPISIKLTKDEVKLAMASGPVYRIFPGEPPIRVTGNNLNSLHVPAKAAKNVAKREISENSSENVVETHFQKPEVQEEVKLDPVIEEKKEIEPEISVNNTNDTDLSIEDEIQVQEEEVVVNNNFSEDAGDELTVDESPEYISRRNRKHRNKNNQQ